MQEQNKPGILDGYWAQFVEAALKGKKQPGDDLSFERRIWFAGVVAVIAHVTQTQDIDAVIGRLGEIVHDMDLIAKREREAGAVQPGEQQPDKVDPDVCYDGS